MPTEEFVMRGQTASGGTEVLNFGSKHGYGFRLIEFELYPSSSIGSSNNEFMATLTAGKTAIAPTDPNFTNEGLIGSVCSNFPSSIGSTGWRNAVINDTFLITQNLIIMVQDTGGGDLPVNWQCRFKPVKLSETEMANANLRQFHVFDE
tara:strand:- start:76 stop:522 length:447 start_codon:yes stop_codon:yes gene_type:complete